MSEQPNKPRRTLVTIAVEIRVELEAVEADYDSALRHAINVGGLLVEAKALVGHGNWMVWLGENFKGSDRTARLYMKLYRDRHGVADMPSITQALEAIAGKPKPQPRPQPEDESVPDYDYDDPEAERRRRERAVAVGVLSQLLARTEQLEAVVGALTEEEFERLLNVLKQAVIWLLGQRGRGRAA